MPTGLPICQVVESVIVVVEVDAPNVLVIDAVSKNRNVVVIRLVDAHFVRI
jgi:hypothetical protein